MAGDKQDPSPATQESGAGYGNNPVADDIGEPGEGEDTEADTSED